MLEGRIQDIATRARHPVIRVCRYLFMVGRSWHDRRDCGHMDGPFGAAQPGCRIRLWWAGDGRYFAGTVGETTVQHGRRVVVFYDDGDSKAHDLRFEDWEPIAEHHRRRPQDRWPQSEEEAIASEWKGFPLSSERGRLQIYAREGMAGVGVRVPAQANKIEAEGEAKALLWFEGTLFSARPLTSAPPS